MPGQPLLLELEHARHPHLDVGVGAIGDLYNDGGHDVHVFLRLPVETADEEQVGGAQVVVIDVNKTEEFRMRYREISRNVEFVLIPFEELVGSPRKMKSLLTVK